MTLRHVPAGEVLTLARRSVQVDPSAEYAEIGIRSYGRGIFHKPAISGADLGGKRVYEIHDGDLVISNVFAWEGAIAVAGVAENGRIGSHRFMTWVPRPRMGDARYLYHYFSSEPGIHQLQRASPGSAGRNRTLAIKAFEDLVIPLPGIDEQRAIAARLDLAATTADTLVPFGVQVERLVAALRNDAFTRSDAEPVELSELITPRRRQVQVVADQNYRTAGVRWYAEGLFHRATLPGSEIKATSVFGVAPGDLVYNRLFAWKGSFALASEHDRDLVVSGEFPVFAIDHNRILPEYLFGWLTLPSTWEAATELSTGGTPTSRNRLKVEQFLKMSLPVPDVDNQGTATNLLRQANEIIRLSRIRQKLAIALPQAARNEVFSKLV